MTNKELNLNEILRIRREKLEQLRKWGAIHLNIEV